MSNKRSKRPTAPPKATPADPVSVPPDLVIQILSELAATDTTLRAQLDSAMWRAAYIVATQTPDAENTPENDADNQ